MIGSLSGRVLPKGPTSLSEWCAASARRATGGWQAVGLELLSHTSGEAFKEIVHELAADLDTATHKQMHNGFWRLASLASANLNAYFVRIGCPPA